MITLSDIHLKFGDQIILDGVTLSIKSKSKIGLIGRNGTGKTTLFKIITDKLKQDAGNVDIPASYKIGYLQQDPNVDLEQSVIDTVMGDNKELMYIESELQKIQTNLEAAEKENDDDKMMSLVNKLTELMERRDIINPDGLRGEAEKMLKGLGFKQPEILEKVGTFSGGWRMRIELAKLLLAKPDTLLLDEPTNHLDIQSILWFEKYLRNFPGSCVVISHDIDFLDNTTKKTWELEGGMVYEFDGSYTKAQEERAERKRLQLAAYENQQKVIKEKQRTIERFRAKATKSSMAKSMEKQLGKMVRVAEVAGEAGALNIKFRDAPRSGEVVLDFKNVAKSFGDNHVFDSVEYKLLRGDKVALVGQNGAGKSTLVKIVADKLEPTSGSVEDGYNVQKCFFHQEDADSLDRSYSVIETIESHSTAEMRTKLRNILGSFLFSGEDIDKKVSVLSGGERTRLVLSTLLLKPYNLIILDEPTNHLDMASKDVLKRALNDYNGSLLIVSHDRSFLRGLTDKTIEIRDGQIHEYLGDIDYFLDKRAFEDIRSYEVTAEKQKAAKKQKPVVSQNELKKLKKKMEKLERDIDGLEGKKTSLESTMGEDGFFSRDNHQETVDSHQMLKKEIDGKTQEWELLAEEILELEG